MDERGGAGGAGGLLATSDIRTVGIQRLCRRPGSAWGGSAEAFVSPRFVLLSQQHKDSILDLALVKVQPRLFERS